MSVHSIAAPMRIETGRFVLRDFLEEDRSAFVAYQTDPRYRALYDIGEDGDAKARALFDHFLEWQPASPRTNIQLGIFGRNGELCGCAGLRRESAEASTAELGIELTPENWGRYRLAVEVIVALADYGFDTLGLGRIVGSTASGNRRVTKLANWFGAQIVASREGPAWMTARGWKEVDWVLNREDWAQSARKRKQRG
jgi:[ribosomal protein S5]-alanine N-acetyltransferase